ncbi:MAG: hypothetical protein ACHQ2Y_05075 [Candidatus Lutacidiplasmatales archaeon]
MRRSFVESCRAGVRRPSRCGPAGTVVAAMFVAVVMAVPSASAARPMSYTIAPYHGTSSLAITSTSARCGTFGGTTAKWSPSIGNATAASKASFHGCPLWVATTSSAISNHTVNVSFPISISSYSYYNVTLTFGYLLTGSTSMKPGSCPNPVNYVAGWYYVYCNALVEWFAQAETSIWDLTTGVLIPTNANVWTAYNYTVVYTSNYCVSGSCSYAPGEYSCSPSTSYYYSPAFVEQQQCLPNGKISSGGQLWANTTTWWPLYNSGSNYTLNPYDKYAFVVSFTTEAYESESTYADWYTGSVLGQHTYPFPGSASASVSALASAHEGFTVSSVVVTAVT